MTMRDEFDNNAKAEHPLGKGEVVSSILTGSTTNPHEIGTSCAVGIPTSAVAGRTEREADVSSRGKSVDSVRQAFTAFDRWRAQTELSPEAAAQAARCSAALSGLRSEPRDEYAQQVAKRELAILETMLRS